MAPRITSNLEQQTSVRGLKWATSVEIVEGPKTADAYTDDGEGMIPFRTSKRLQGAIYRMIQQRDPGRHDSNVPPKDKNSSTLLSPRSPKRQQHSSAEPILPKSEENGEARQQEDGPLSIDTVKETSCRNKRRKTCTVQFADPLVTYIEDCKREVPIMLPSGKELPISENDFLQSRKTHLADDAAATPTKSSADDNYRRRHRPMSCFDLLCNHIGPRGWRCYRSSMDGKSHCSYHQTRNLATSPDRGLFVCGKFGARSRTHIHVPGTCSN